MHLEELRIRRAQYGKNEGRLEGEIVYASPTGKVQVILDEDLATKLLYVVAENMVKTTQELANQLTAQVLTQTPALVQR